MKQYANSSSVSTLRSLSPWQASWQTLQANWREILKLALLAVTLPLLLIDIAQSWHSFEHVQQLRELGRVEPQPHVEGFVENSLTYLRSYFFYWLLTCCLIGASFFALLFQARGLYQENITPKVVTCLKAGFKLFFTRGILALVLTIISLLLVANLVISLFGLGGIGEAILLVYCALHFMIPVLLVQTSANPIRIVLSAITLGYVPRIRGVRWSVFFQLIAWEFLAVLTLTLINFTRSNIISLDLWLPIPREIWLQGFGELPFGPVYLLATAISALIFTALLCLLAMVMTVYYSRLLDIYNRIQEAIHEASQSL